MSKGIGYSVWLMPTGNVYDRLAKLISQLSKQYSTYNFEPHVTLIAGLVGSKDEIISKTSQLADNIKPFEITTTRIEYLDEYFKCLFIRVKETAELMKANVKAREIFFGKLETPKYIPHLSLLYGNFLPKTKEEIIANIGNDFEINFDVKSIHLFFTDGEVKDWYKVKEFNLK